MTIPLATLGQFRLGTTEYGAARARTDGSWHLVRKQYGDNCSTYTYARFSSKADYLAARANPNLAQWQDEPFSAVDYSLLLAGLTSPLPSSTTLAGVLAASVASSSSDNAGVVQAIEEGNALLTSMLAGQSSTGSRATETTLAKVLAALVGTLKVGVDGQVGIANFPAGFRAYVDNWPATQAVSLVAVPLAAGAASSAAQLLGNASLAEISTKLGGSLTVTFPATQAVSASALPLPTGAATAALQTTGNTLLQTIATNTAAAPTVSMSPKISGGTVASMLLSVAGNNATSLKKAPGQVYGINAHNISTSWRYVQLYDSASAPGSGATPALVIAVAPGGVRDVSFALGVPFAAGISFTITAKPGLLDLLSVVLAGEVGVNIEYA